MSVSRCADFRLKPTGESAAGVWTPYCFDEASNRMALVACPPKCDLTAAPFYYQAQYQQAVCLQLLSREEVFSVAEAHAPRFRTPVMIYSTGRAGTTLVSKMLGRLSECVSVSEPDFHTSLLQSGMVESDGANAATWLRAADQLYFQPRSEQHATHLVLKFRGMCVELAATIRAAHSHVIECFLYRDAESYVESSMRAFGYFRSPLWYLRWLHRLVVTRPILTHALGSASNVTQRFFPLAQTHTARELARLGPVGLLALSWVSMMHRARTLRLPSLDYKVLLHHPQSTLERLLAHCQLPTDRVDVMLAALHEDSQNGSIVERSRTSAYRLSIADRETIRSVLARHKIIDRTDFELPNAIA